MRNSIDARIVAEGRKVASQSCGALQQKAEPPDGEELGRYALAEANEGRTCGALDRSDQNKLALISFCPCPTCSLRP